METRAAQQQVGVRQQHEIVPFLRTAMVLIDAVLRQRARMAAPCKTLGELGQCGGHAFSKARSHDCLLVSPREPNTP